MFKLCLPLLFLSIVGCVKKYKVLFDDKRLSVKSGGAMYYDGIPLNGEIVREFAGTNAKNLITYRNGLENGPTRTWAENGVLIEERTYQGGIKQGVHRGWHDNGKYRFYAEFEKGRYVGESWSWYKNGQVYEYKKYDDAGNVTVHKQLRENGQVYQNIIISPTGQVGIPGSKNCDTVKQKT